MVRKLYSDEAKFWGDYRVKSQYSEMTKWWEEIT